MSGSIREALDGLAKAADVDLAEVKAIRYYPHRATVDFVTRTGVRKVAVDPAPARPARKAAAKKAPAKKAPAKKAAKKKA